MALSFADSISRNILSIQTKLNSDIYKISIELFLLVVAKSPSPANPGETAVGLLANQWYPAVNDFSAEVNTDKNFDGADSKARIVGLRGGREFIGKDGRLTLTNNLDYAYRAEMLGWPTPEWSGKIGPYRMVALALQEIAARYK